MITIWNQYMESIIISYITIWNQYMIILDPYGSHFDPFIIGGHQPASTDGK